MAIKTKMKFENTSVNGRDLRVKGVHIYIPGNSTVMADVPCEMVQAIQDVLRKTATAITVTIEGKIITEDKPVLVSLPVEDVTEEIQEADNPIVISKKTKSRKKKTK